MGKKIISPKDNRLIEALKFAELKRLERKKESQHKDKLDHRFVFKINKKKLQQYKIYCSLSKRSVGKDLRGHIDRVIETARKQIEKLT